MILSRPCKSILSVCMFLWLLMLSPVTVHAQNSGQGSNAGSASSLLGCDTAVLERNEALIDAVNQANAEIGKANITQPTSVEQMTCADQQLELLNQTGGIHSQPQTGDISASIGPYAQQPLMQTIDNTLNSVSAAINPIDNIINNAFNSIVSSFLGGLGGGLNNNTPVSTDCDMTEQVWLVNQCIEMPQLPSVSDILDGAMGNIDVAGPGRMIEQVCEAANSKIQGLTSDVNSVFNSSANAISDPISDTLGSF